MDWMASVDIYCERMSAAFWAEPINAISNLAFILAALAGWREARRLDKLDGPIRVLCGVVIAIGIGSFLFHTFAQRWAGVADTVPILLFIILFLIVSMNRLFGLRWPMAVGVSLIAFGVSLLARQAVVSVTNVPLNGSESYTPAFALLAGCALALWFLRSPAARGIALAAALFAVSLVARTVDPALCVALPFGTHFAWHLLNGTMIAVLLLTLVRHGRPA